MMFRVRAALSSRTVSQGTHVSSAKCHLTTTSSSSSNMTRNLLGFCSSGLVTSSNNTAGFNHMLQRRSVVTKDDLLSILEEEDPDTGLQPAVEKAVGSSSSSRRQYDAPMTEFFKQVGFEEQTTTLLSPTTFLEGGAGKYIEPYYLNSEKIPKAEQGEDKSLGLREARIREEDIFPLGKQYRCPYTGKKFDAKSTISDIKRHIFKEVLEPMLQKKSVANSQAGATPSLEEAMAAEKPWNEADENPQYYQVPEPIAICPKCGTKFWTVEEYLDHLDYEDATLPCKRIGEDIICPASGKRVPAKWTPGKLKWNIVRYTWGASPFFPRSKPFRCPHCRSTFENFDDYWKHLTREYQCPAQGKGNTLRLANHSTFKNYSNKLKTDYKCPFSGKHFDQGTPVPIYINHLEDWWCKDYDADLRAKVLFHRPDAFFCTCGLGFHNFKEFRQHLIGPVNNYQCLRPRIAPPPTSDQAREPELIAEVDRIAFERDQKAKKEAEMAQFAAEWNKSS